MYVSGLVRVTIEEFSAVFRAEGFVYRWDCCCFSWANAGNVVYIVSGRTVYTGYESLQWAHRTVWCEEERLALAPIDLARM
jgi:hypothetical protein